MKKLIATLKEKWAEYILEILVITIGIVGAFLLNSWNEQVKANHQQQEIITNLHEEFETNLASLEKQISRLDQKSKVCVFLLEVSGQNDLLDEIANADSLIQKLYDNPTWNPSTYVLSDLRNSGQLKSLKNEQLKELLHNWEQHYENLKEYYELEMSLYDNFFHLMEENGSARNAIFKQRLGSSTLANDNLELLMNPKFENQLSHILMITASLNSIYTNQTVELINQILKETE
ncbi:DUF6090 family protein [Marinoscillum pacificum]|uniref:DUF6090 family protein n=1 Tax=Marinoscillum pacificum TaxID=392723 RepID=UPI0021582374|nr:DUF6090 family protein [Marinoscillum pacificum]